MLVLKRHTGDHIDLYIRDPDNADREICVSISVLGIGQGAVRVGVEAPESVLILRREVPRKPKDGV